MPCYHPLIGRMTRAGAPLKIMGSANSVQRLRLDEITIPCGQCTGCRLERSRQWAIRCVHEASMHEKNCFVTLTYADQHLPTDGSLKKKHFQNFMKKLRKALAPQRIRFYHCGEYGERFNRPHYHALLFGVDFPDKTLWARNKGNPIYRSPTLEKIWTHGNATIGTVTFESAAYVARYIMKKVTGPDAQNHYGQRTPEYTTMSRRPGIGANWLSKFKDEVYPQDRVYMRGRLMKPPRAYDVAHDLHHPEHMEQVRQQRRKKRRRQEENSDRRAAGEAIAKARLTLSRRTLG